MDNQYFSNRRTIREYSKQEVSMELISDIMDKAMRAPNTGNMQLYSAIVTTDEQIKKQLLTPHFNQPQVTSAPVVITFCADLNRFVAWCKQNDAHPGYDNLQSLFFATLDTAIFAQQFNTIAELNGLGCCYLGTTTYNAKEIAEILDLPKRVIPVTTLTVGYPANEPEQVERLPLDGIMHMEKYHDYTPQRISEIHHDKEALDVNKKYVKDNSLKTLAQVFTDVRYTKSDNEAFSEKFLEFIKSQGFRIPF